MLLGAGGRIGGVSKFLFELLPDIFPQGFLTRVEIELWGEYYQEMKNRQLKGL